MIRSHGCSKTKPPNLLFNPQESTMLYEKKNVTILTILILLLFFILITGKEVSAAEIALNTGAVGNFPSVSGPIIAFTTYESDAFVDLNKDGDMNDFMIRYYSVSDKSLVNTGLMGGIIGIRRPMQQLGQVNGEGPSVSGSVIAYTSYEYWYYKESFITKGMDGLEGDLNGDGDWNDYVIQYYDILDRSSGNTRTEGRFPCISGPIIVFSTYEYKVDKDLNGDGDKDDYVIQYYDISKKNLVNTGVVGGSREEGPTVSGPIIAFTVYEGSVDKDLNSDGDKNDYIIHYYDISRKDLVNTGAIGGVREEGPSVSGSVIAFTTHEAGAGEDLNGDGDKDDYVIRYYDITNKFVVNTGAAGRLPSVSGSIIAFTSYEDSAGKDLNGDGDKNDYVIQYYDISKKHLVNTGVVGGSREEGPTVSGSVIAFTTQEGSIDKDLNGDGDKHDSVIRYLVVQ
jgi:hypothetical protein